MKRLAVLLAAGALALAGTPGASAVAGSTPDPNDNAGRLDFKTASHSDTASSVTWTLDFYDAWTANDTPYYELTWFLGFDNDANTDDACVIVGQRAATDYEYTLYKGDCHDGTPTPVAVAAGTATRGASNTALSLTVNLADLRSAGLASNATFYRYLIEAHENSSVQPADTVPDTGYITHTFDTPPTTTTTTTTVTSQSAASASPSTLAAGQRTTVTGFGFAPNADLTATLFSDPVVLASFKADSVGRYSVVLTIPATTFPGTHRLVVSGLSPTGTRHESSATLTIVLPRTGAASSTGQTGATGVAIAALGFALLMLAYYERRRVSVGATRAAAALGAAFNRDDR